MNKRNTLLIALSLLFSTAVNAEVKLHKIFSSDMILQRDQPITVWGWADPQESVKVSFAGETATAVADKSGNWSIDLPSQSANAKGQTMTVEGKNKIELTNILLGDIWLCSGQSNMEWGMWGSDDPDAIANADLPMIRLVKVPLLCKERPEEDIDTENLSWVVCSPKTLSPYSAVGFYFARKVNAETGIPQGVLVSSVGGTNIEKWMPRKAFLKNPYLSDYNNRIEEWMKEYRKDVESCMTPLEKWIKDSKKAIKSGTEIPSTPYVPLHPSMPNSKYGGGQYSHLFNGMIAPITKFKIKGALWYQGENNGQEEKTYLEKKREMIGAWRELWGYEFPFYFVQLAPWLKPNDDPSGGKREWQYCRAAQLECIREIPKTGMAVILDVGDAEDIHPRNKFDVGERLALWALAKDYGKNIVYSGPIYKSIKQEGDKIRVEFESTGSGLMAGIKKGFEPAKEDKGAKLKRFAVAGEDKVWHWADAVIDGNTVVVSSADVKKPVAVRYAFSMNPEGANLYNKEGIPASPFRSDNWD